MNYAKHYKLLIEKAKERILKGYVEKHHILPRAFGGSNETINIVKLTAREHFIAHLLLYKMQIEKRPRYQMLLACILMKGKDKKNSKLYEAGRIEFSKMQSERMAGENHPMFGTSRCGIENPFFGKTHSNETKKRLSDIGKKMVLAKDKLTGKNIKVLKEDFDANNNLVGITNGTKISNEVKQNISKGLKNKPILTCPHCLKQGKLNMNRYHFDKCKFNIAAI